MPNFQRVLAMQSLWLCLGCNADDQSPSQALEDVPAPYASEVPSDGFTPTSNGGLGEPPSDAQEASANEADAGARGASQVVVPCGNVPADGVCATHDRVDRCIVPTGDGVPSLTSEYCRPSEHCIEERGVAHCEQLPNRCVAGSQRCSGQDSLERCSDDGEWLRGPCDGDCQPSALGAFCAQTTTIEYTGNIEYELRLPNSQLSDWDDTIELRPAEGLLVVSTRGEDLLGATTTDAEGRFRIRIPLNPQPEDDLLVMLMRPDDAGTGPAYAVLRPNAPDGESSYLRPTEAGAAEHWTWSIDPNLVSPDSTLRITEALGSGAVHLFEQVGSAIDFTREHLDGPGRSLVVWFRPNSWWNCGSCFFPQPLTVGPLRFDAQLLIPSRSSNTSYWADTVTAHEMGHWAMWSYSRRPNEGGPHCLGVPTQPGQAWSEGWATAFSSLLRDDPRYWDKQYGTFFSLDLAERTYPAGLTWVRPEADGSLQQAIDENEVAAMIWQLSQQPDVEASILMSALGSPLVGEPPFGRGYTRHSWTVDEQCVRESVEDLEISAPTFADYLDALHCLDVPEDQIAAAIQPDEHDPYDGRPAQCP